MSKHLKVAMIGTGGISRTHMPGWQASEYAEVVAASDVNSASLEAWGKTWNVDRLTTDVQEIIEDPKIDIIDICTPNNTHAEIALAEAEGIIEHVSIGEDDHVALAVDGLLERVILFGLLLGFSS